MNTSVLPIDRHERARIARYVLNGVLATAIHFGVLVFLREVVGVGSAGLANFIAAGFGIGASFIGSRYYVFPGTGNAILPQAAQFVALYAAIACLHGLILYVWTDRMGLDYRVGFVIATVVQVVGSYLGNKYLVFRT